MDFLQMRVAGKKAQKPARILRRLARWQMRGTCENLLPLAIKPHRQAGLEPGAGMELTSAKLAPSRERAAATKTLVSRTTLILRNPPPHLSAFDNVESQSP